MKVVTKKVGYVFLVSGDGIVSVKDDYQTVLVEEWWLQLIKDFRTYFYTGFFLWYTIALYLAKEKSTIVICSIAVCVSFNWLYKHISSKFKN